MDKIRKHIIKPIKLSIDEFEFNIKKFILNNDFGIYDNNLILNIINNDSNLNIFNNINYQYIIKKLFNNYSKCNYIPNTLKFMNSKINEIILEYNQNKNITNIKYEDNNKPPLGFFTIENYSFFGFLMGVNNYNPTNTYCIMYFGKNINTLYFYIPYDGNCFNNINQLKPKIWTDSDFKDYIKLNLNKKYSSNLQNNPKYWNWVLNYYNFKLNKDEIFNDIKKTIES